MDTQLPAEVAQQSKGANVEIFYSTVITLQTPRQMTNIITGKVTQTSTAEVGCRYSNKDSVTAQANMLTDLKLAGYDTITKTFPNIK